jgi:hypothetical protein
MKTFNTFQEALDFQKQKGSYEVTKDLATGLENIDRIQFSIGEVVWLILADGYYLDDYEEGVTQYGITATGEWAAVSGGHCSCFGWEEMSSKDITYYPSLEVILKADKNADVIVRHRDLLKGSYLFLDF